MWKLSWDSCILNHRSIVGSTSVYACFDLMIKRNYQGVKLWVQIPTVSIKKRECGIELVDCMGFESNEICAFGLDFFDESSA